MPLPTPPKKTQSAIGIWEEGVAGFNLAQKGRARDAIIMRWTMTTMTMARGGSKEKSINDSRGSSTRLPAIYFFSWQEPFSSKPLRIEIETDRQATKRETIFDNAHQQINCTCQLSHADQSHYSITSMSIAINS